jgi:hypothetical protein
MARRKASDLLTEIHDGALDSSVPLPDLLRKCITLGGETGSERLRAWATDELKGYSSGDQVPEYRKVPAMLSLDGLAGRTHITGQQVPWTLLPDFTRERFNEPVLFMQALAQLVQLERHSRESGDPVRISPPFAPELVTLINQRLRDSEPKTYGFDLPPSRVVERIYWQVGASDLASIIDTVRTTLVELVAEMRVGTPAGANLPPRDVTEQAVDIAVFGNRNRIVVNQAAPEASGSAGGKVSSVGSVPETKPRRVMWWVVGAASVAGAIAGVIAIFVH